MVGSSTSIMILIEIKKVKQHTRLNAEGIATKHAHVGFVELHWQQLGSVRTRSVDRRLAPGNAWAVKCAQAHRACEALVGPTNTAQATRWR